MGNELYQLITWFLVITGWVVVHYLSAVRDRQKDIRDLKLKTIQAIIDTEKLAIDFHMAANFDLGKTQQLTSMIQRISCDMTRPPLATFQNFSSVVKEFRQSITLQNFDISRFQRQQASSKIISKINYTTEQIIRALETGYDNRYMRAWWQIFRI